MAKNGNGKSTDLLILRELQGLRRDFNDRIEALDTSLSGRIDAVSASVDDLRDDMVAGFAEVRLELGEVRAEVVNVKREVALLRRTSIERHLDHERRLR